MKKLLLLCLLILTLFLAFCGEPRYKILGDARLEDCTLTIHYEDPNLWRRFQPCLRDFLKYSDYHATVSGIELKGNKQFHALLKMLDRQEMPPVQDITNYWWEIQPDIYYSLTAPDGEMLFDVTFGFVGGVYFNGEKVPYDKLYYISIEPYLTEPHYAHSKY